jgi:hypothetical protein
VNVTCASAGQTISLPLANSVPAGGSFYIYNQGNAYTLARSGSDFFSADGSSKTSFLIPTGGIVEAVSNGVNGWTVGGTGLNSQVGDFQSSLASSGYQKLPSGLIIQWGATADLAINTNATLNFHVAFPTACLRVLASATNSLTTDDDTFGRVISYTASQVVLRTEAAQGVQAGLRKVEYLAIGY